MTMKRHVVALGVALLSWAGLAMGQPVSESTDRYAYVRARLILVEPQAPCGISYSGSRALYMVQEGPDGLRGEPLEVVVGCIEMPMTEWDGMGDLKTFVPGDTHYLRISRDNLRGVGLYDDKGGRAWHLLAASLQPLQRSAASAIREADVRAVLIRMERGPGCGNLFVGSNALYVVEDGPGFLKGRPLEVVVGCIEMPMTGGEGMGDLQAFVPGDTHYLRISRDNLRKVEVYDDRGGSAWHLLAASLTPLATQGPPANP
ncbi:hypothetical protein [Pseudoxanthomonas sp. PXM01]|uniref:hypothetical protein n=1 Tax=Pseudoxanthomonas sp. PXM01 TaxID=2769295 RepID=UPI00177DD21B|nr:hypothetical protein [Pseudoxanthomonas sp. PXM01]MBD9467481.1 hypothetical protein [Pseudoxanthomonas sp. PXM01]